MATFVGFGFGAIQAGLFLYEAFRSRAFDRLVVVEVAPHRVADLRAADGLYHLNIAHVDRIERVAVGPVEIYNPTEPADRAAAIDAVAEADELATAIPSVSFYGGDGPDALANVLAAGIAQKVRRAGPQAVLYAAENHNHAAELLAAAVSASLSEAGQAEMERYVAFLNTVIGKMSGMSTVDAAPDGRKLAPIAPGGREAFLVEEFNRILVTAPQLPQLPSRPAYVRRLDVFAEKADLLPFEEAKLYGHNALHAVAGYLGRRAGLTYMAELTTQPEILALARRAALEEAGAALCRRYAGTDPLFTAAGFAAYADDLLTRMVNPFLQDAIARVTRDPARKLGWDDRLIGALRLTLAAGEAPRSLAQGAAAAYDALLADDSTGRLTQLPMAQALTELWQIGSPASMWPSPEADAVVAWLEHGRVDLAKISL